MADKPIQNCEVRFRFQCPKQWEALAETEEFGVRSCSQCQKRVYLCENKKAVAWHAQQGHCIAVPRWVTSPSDFPEDYPERVRALARQYDLPFIQLRDHALDPDVVRLVPREVARQHNVIPVRRVGNRLTLAMSNPADLRAFEDVSTLTGFSPGSMDVVVASRREIEQALDEAEHNDSDDVLLGEVYEEDF